MGVAKWFRRCGEKLRYAREERQFNRAGLRRNPGEREYPLQPGRLDGIEAGHLFRYEWANPWCKGKTVLDYGCGVGYGSYILSEVGLEVVGYDISEDALDWARHYAEARPNLRFTSIPPTERFEVATCLECMEHVTDPRALVDWLAEHVSELLLASTPEAKEGKWSPYHNIEFTEEEFLGLLATRFQIEQVDHQHTDRCRAILARCRPPRR